MRISVNLLDLDRQSPLESRGREGALFPWAGAGGELAGVRGALPTPRVTSKCALGSSRSFLNRLDPALVSYYLPMSPRKSSRYHASGARISRLRRTASDRTPLLPGTTNGDSAHPPTTFKQRAAAFVNPAHGPSFAKSMRFFFFGTWFNVFLVFVPLSVISHHAGWDAGLRFTFSFLAILPLAKVSHSLYRYISSN